MVRRSVSGPLASVFHIPAEKKTNEREKNQVSNMYKNELQEETRKADLWEETVGEIWAKGDDLKDPRTTWHGGVWCRRKKEWKTVSSRLVAT